MKTYTDIVDKMGEKKNENGLDIDITEIDYKQALLDYVNSLEDDEAESVYNIIMNYFNFDADDDIDDNDDDSYGTNGVNADEVGEGLLFKTKKATLLRVRKANPMAVKAARKKAHLNYVKNKSKIKLHQKLYKKKVLNNPGKVRHHI